MVKSLNHQVIRQHYPEAVRKLDSTDPKEVIVGLRILAATGEPAAIPWIVPHLESDNADVRISTGGCLENLVSGHELKRRDYRHSDRIVIKPPGPNDLNLKPVGWAILKMLRKPDDGNTHAYAATMIGYLGLREFEGELRTLLKSRHPAVTRAARNALTLIDAKLSELDETQARDLATTLANEAFAQKRFLDAANKPIPTVVLKAENWQVVEKKDERWILKFDPPDGPQAEVTFDLYGSHPRVVVGYALE